MIERPATVEKFVVLQLGWKAAVILEVSTFLVLGGHLVVSRIKLISGRLTVITKLGQHPSVQYSMHR